MESFRITVYAVFLGVGIATLLCVPDWAVFRGEPSARKDNSKIIVYLLYNTSNIVHYIA